MNKAAKTFILVIIAIFSTAVSLHCGPVRQTEAIYTQPDGSTFNVRVRGDEWIRIRTTLDGCAIAKNEEGWWCYGVYGTDGYLTCSEHKIGQSAPPEIIRDSRNIPYEILNAKAAAYRAQRNAVNSDALHRIRRSAALTKTQTEKITKRGIAILAQFQDTKFTYSKEDFYNLLNQKGYNNTGSVKDYYESQFGEGWEFIFEVSDIVTLPNNVLWCKRSSRWTGQQTG